MRAVYQANKRKSTSTTTSSFFLGEIGAEALRPSRIVASPAPILLSRATAVSFPGLIGAEALPPGRTVAFPGKIGSKVLPSPPPPRSAQNPQERKTGRHRAVKRVPARLLPTARSAERSSPAVLNIYLSMTTLSRCQISSTYSLIVRSEENLPLQAVFIIAMRAQPALSR